MTAAEMDFDHDKRMAQSLLDRLGGALTVEDILLLRAASVWHNSMRMLKVAEEFGDDGDPMTSEEQRALDIVGMLPEADDNGAIELNSDAVRGQLNRAEVAVGYLFAKHGVPMEDRPPSYPSTDYEPALGPMDVIEVWDKLTQANPQLKLSDEESAWVNASLNKDVDES